MTKRSTRSQGTRVVVIGGGFSGLAAAALAAQRGFQVTLFDEHESLGGRARTWSQNGFTFDTGPSWLLMPEVFQNFYAQLGKKFEDEISVVRLDPAYQLFFDGPGNPEHIRTGLGNAVEIWERYEPGSGPKIERYLELSRKLYRFSLDHALYKQQLPLAALNQAKTGVAASTAVRLLTGNLAKHTASQFQHPLLLSLLQYPAIFLGTDPRRTPALYSLMNYLDLLEGVFYPMGGFGAVVDSLTKITREQGAVLETNSRVRSVLHTGKTATGVLVENRVSGELRQVEADIIISAVDTQQLRVLMNQPQAQARTARPGMAAVLACLGVDGKLPQLQHHNFFFSGDWYGNMERVFGNKAALRDARDETSLYACMPSATDPSTAPEGAENLFLLVPVPQNPELGKGAIDAQGDPAVEETVDAAVRQLAAWSGIADLSNRIVVRRSFGPGDFHADYHSPGGALLGPEHTLRQSSIFRGTARSGKVSNIYQCGASVAPGVGVPLTLISAQLAVESVMEDYGHEQKTA